MNYINFPSHVAVTFFEESAILLDSRKNIYYTLNETAANFFQLLNKNISVENSVEQIISSYQENAAIIREDLQILVKSLIEKGLIEIVNSEQ